MKTIAQPQKLMTFLLPSSFLIGDDIIHPVNIKRLWHYWKLSSINPEDSEDQNT